MVQITDRLCNGSQTKQIMSYKVVDIGPITSVMGGVVEGYVTKMQFKIYDL